MANVPAHHMNSCSLPVPRGLAVLVAALALGCGGSVRTGGTSPGDADAGLAADAIVAELDAPEVGPPSDHDAAASAVTQDAGVDALASDATTSADAPASLDEAGIPIDLAAFRNDIAQASARAQAAGGPAWCAMALPSVRVSSAAEVTAAVRSFVSQVLGTAASNLQMAPQACGDPGHAPCADVFNLNAGGFGGPINTEIYPLAQRIDQNATSVQVTVVTLPPSGGASVVVTAGIKDGWLMGLAVFGGLRCG